MTNRTVPAAAEGLPATQPWKTTSLESVAGLTDPLTLAIMEQYRQMLPWDQKAFRAAATATRDGVDPTEEIVAAVGLERAEPFLAIWRVFVEDEARKSEAAR